MRKKIIKKMIYKYAKKEVIMAFILFLSEIRSLRMKVLSFVCL